MSMLHRCFKIFMVALAVKFENIMLVYHMDIHIMLYSLTVEVYDLP